ncbi:MAG TPA: nucleotidyl transferase AbiEii/AbiGii toxin family protein [Solirubrobacteraceae bacterium]|nr:nucleotidyl transferase AbiEii/AbiGii toxin family protein [Solirubrobacteraceae bacterium]
MGVPVRRIHSAFELQDVVEQAGADPSLIERDFALVTLAAGLVQEYGDSLCFKGGFVLRHVYGHERFSKDIDATRINPPKNKLDAQDVAETIKRAGIRNLLSLNPGDPARNSKHGLDFDSVGYSGPLGKGTIAVEVSYREEVIENPHIAAIGPPYYEPFEVPVLQLVEIVAEKLRALAQRIRATDLSDLAMVLDVHEIDDAHVKTLAVEKFKLVKGGAVSERIIANIDAMAAQYDSAIAATAPDAPTYGDARRVVSSRLRTLLP